MSKLMKLTFEDTSDGDSSKNNSTVFLSKRKMEQMQLKPFDHVLVKGFHRKEMLYFVDEDKDDACPDTSIRISGVVQSNLRVTVDDTITLQKSPKAKYADLVELHPVVDESNGITE